MANPYDEKKNVSGMVTKQQLDTSRVNHATTPAPTTAAPVVSAPTVDYSGYFNTDFLGGVYEGQRAAAQNAFGNAKGNLQASFNAQADALKNNYNSALNQLKNNYDYSNSKVNADAEKSLKEAYVNYMMNKKNMDQNLAARGVGGGAAESTLAGMYNNYGNSRNGINTTLNENIADLLNAYQNNQASAQQAYNTNYSNAYGSYLNNLTNLETQLANAISASYANEASQKANYLSALQNVVLNEGGANMANALLSAYAGAPVQSYQFSAMPIQNYQSQLSNQLNSAVQNMADTPTQATQNTYALDNVNVAAQNNNGTGTNYTKVAESMRRNGARDEQIIARLAAMGAGINQVFAALGVQE